MLRQLLNIAKKNNYVVYTEPYKLNIWGVRSDSTQSNVFDDIIAVFWKNDKNKWEFVQYKATTDPGTYWLQNPMQSLGAAILKQGQYLDAWQRGMAYRSSGTLPYPYELRQVKPVTIIRDYNRDAILDFWNGRETTGLYGINIHVGANRNQTSLLVNLWSAGCQVFASYNDYAHFDTLCQKHIALHGNSFSYTLVDNRARVRAKRRLTLNFLLAGTAIALAGYGIYRYVK